MVSKTVFSACQIPKLTCACSRRCQSISTSCDVTDALTSICRTSEKVCSTNDSRWTNASAQTCIPGWASWTREGCWTCYADAPWLLIIIVEGIGSLLKGWILTSWASYSSTSGRWKSASAALSLDCGWNFF